MREIKFIGKAIMPIHELNQLEIEHYNGWVSGNLINGAEPYIVGPIIENGDEYITHEWFVKITPGTQRQYIGLKDCTETEVHEGDLVKDFISDKTYQVIWDDYGLFIFTEIGSTNGGFDYYEFEEEAFKDCVAIIGNIHDNPELLGDSK